MQERLIKGKKLKKKDSAYVYENECKKGTRSTFLRECTKLWIWIL